MRDLFLDGMSRAACTVSVVTTDGPGGRAGVTVSAMSSLSADTPTPSLLVCINQQSVAGKTIVANGAFCVNVLRDDQITISDVFAGRQKTSSGDKFDAGVWRSSRSGTPVLSDALVAFDCQLKQYVPYGTHWILIGELTDIAINEPSSPLIYTNRAYGTSVPLLRSAAQIPTEDGERLRIGCLDIPGPFFMAQLVASFTSVWPHTRLDVVEADQDGLREAIRRSTVELAITYDLGIGR
ncbi:MAG TPA: flavin reductase, partial [Microvirga sp.]|nr:flavin reductase [Microvirga sp.]